MSVVSGRRAVLFSAALVLAGCATEPVPDFRYFRFGEAAAVSRLPTPALQLPLVIEPFRADGVMGERPILYATRSETVRLSQYHYQLWNDPPPVLVRQRLMDQLAAAAVAPIVTERLSPRVEALRLQGRIEEFQRVRDAGGDQVVVSVLLRLERDRVGLPLIERRFRQQLPASGDDLEASVRVFGQAVDAIAAELLTELAALPPETHAAAKVAPGA
jgi:cholesterol transport system auxiliary component